MRFVQIEDDRTLVRDVTNKAILNTDVSSLERYYAQRKIAKQRLKQQEEVKERVDKIEEDISEIKEMLHHLIKMRTTDDNQ
jgi:tRNA U55 pseudouridine synthase TruB